MRASEWALGLAARFGLPDAPRSETWTSVCTEARAPLVASILQKRPIKTLIVVGTYERALQWQAKLSLCGVPQEIISILPSGSSALFEDAAPEHIALSDRLGALRKLAEDIPAVVIATPQAALERTLPKDALLESFIEIKPGDVLDPTQFLKTLGRLGYEHQEPVRLPGGFSRRGGIIDVFPVGRDTPIRIELFGDEVETLRIFDPNSQRSIGGAPVLRIAPSREVLYLGEIALVKQLILDGLEQESSALQPEAAERLQDLVSADADSIGQRVFFDRLDLYRPLLHPDSGCAVDLLSPEDLLILDEPVELEALSARADDELSQALHARIERGEILRAIASDFQVGAERLGEFERTIAMTSLDTVPAWAKDLPERSIGAQSLERYRGRGDLLTQAIKSYKESGYQITLTTDQPSRATSVLAQVDISVVDTVIDGALALVHGNLGGGFEAIDAKTVLLSDAELFGVARLKLPQRRFMEGAPVATVLDLKPGDHVVHIHFGIGVFRGLIKRMEHGIEKEFLYIEYQAPDKLFVPADQLDRIQKYLNPSDDDPKLNRLTGVEWQRTLGKAKDEAREFARDLVKLYAQRHAVIRPNFGPDTPWQYEMESTFPYVETPAQLAAINDVKKDLELDHPMDRLVCGDVGFGKTEVAIRAAFKVAQAGRQVAVLCPTTILSEQHFRNFSERLQSFGVRLDIVNRFRTAAERASTLDRLAKGEIDVLIGTHALLGAGVVFKNLGMVVIDEEQRFGVKQKEMLKKLRAQVDVLTLSATPIPRTLSMALMDIRQMSLINDPPPGRLPVRSFLRPYGGEVVREAILRELARGGQVFYVYNRVDTIGHVAQQLKKLAPSARIGVAHGQMNEKEIEPIMVGFIAGEIDVLLSTTIIENGIDIANANTLIVESADRLGLAQLYQLRGRVGRSDRQAYAYFLYSSGKDLTDNAMARLQALQEFSTLGSGYSLAFRDLQIRGAGELLGAKQHGAVASVGYELYTQLINEAVAMLKASFDSGEAPELVDDPLETLEPLPAFDLPIKALLPDTYIRDHAQRLYFYQRMMSARTESALNEVGVEIEDRYGKPPSEVGNALTTMRLRMEAKSLGIANLDAKQERLTFEFRDLSSISPRVFSILGGRNRSAYFGLGKWVWPYGGQVLPAIEVALDAFRQAKAQAARELTSVPV